MSMTLRTSLSHLITYPQRIGKTLFDTSTQLIA
jgi:hypothetical protein